MWSWMPLNELRSGKQFNFSEEQQINDLLKRTKAAAMAEQQISNLTLECQRLQQQTEDDRLKYQQQVEEERQSHLKIQQQAEEDRLKLLQQVEEERTSRLNLEEEYRREKEENKKAFASIQEQMAALLADRTALAEQSEKDLAEVARLTAAKAAEEVDRRERARLQAEEAKRAEEKRKQEAARKPQTMAEAAVAAAFQAQVPLPSDPSNPTLASLSPVPVSAANLGNDFLISLRHGHTAANALEPFAGPTSYRSAAQFLKQFRRSIQNTHESNAPLAIVTIAQYLRDRAMIWYDNHVDGTHLLRDWASFEKAFLERFGKVTSEMLRNSAYTRCQGKDESVKDFALDFQRLSASEDWSDAGLARQFTSKLRSDITACMSTNNFDNLDGAIADAVAAENMLRLIDIKTKRQADNTASTIAAAAVAAVREHTALVQHGPSEVGLAAARPYNDTGRQGGRDRSNDNSNYNRKQHDGGTSTNKPKIAPGPRRLGRCTFSRCRSCGGKGGIHLILEKFWTSANELPPQFTSPKQQEN